MQTHESRLFLPQPVAEWQDEVGKYLLPISQLQPSTLWHNPLKNHCQCRKQSCCLANHSIKIWKRIGLRKLYGDTSLRTRIIELLSQLPIDLWILQDEVDDCTQQYGSRVRLGSFTIVIG